jgi:hypothetical protein
VDDDHNHDNDNSDHSEVDNEGNEGDDDDGDEDEDDDDNNGQANDLRDNKDHVPKINIPDTVVSNPLATPSRNTGGVGGKNAGVWENYNVHA